jgi:hypothetical protein
VAQAEDTAPATSAFPLAGTYTDETGEQYQIGIAEGFQLDSAQGNPIFSAPDGSLAYSLVTVPLSNEAPLADVALAAVVQDTFGNGEGFQTQGFQATNQGLQVAWTGLFSQGSQPPVAMAGTVVAQQRGTTVYLLMVAAQPAAQAQVPEVVGALLDSLQIQ